MGNENAHVAGANIQFFEITSKSCEPGIECLKIEMVKKEPIFNIRNWNLRKRRRIDSNEETSTSESDQRVEK